MLEHLVGPRYALENPPVLFKAPFNVAAISPH
jgi:hypothetical protein